MTAKELRDEERIVLRMPATHWSAPWSSDPLLRAKSLDFKVTIPVGGDDWLGHGCSHESKVAKLGQTVAELENKVAQLSSLVRSREAELRDVPRDQAKEEVLDYFIDGGSSYPSDAARALRLDALLVLELCEELEAEGLLR